MLIPHSLTKSYFTNIFPFYASMLYCLVPSNGVVFFTKRLANEKSKLSKPYKKRGSGDCNAYKAILEFRPPGTLSPLILTNP